MRMDETSGQIAPNVIQVNPRTLINNQRLLTVCEPSFTPLAQRIRILPISRNKYATQTEEKHVRVHRNSDWNRGH